MAREGEKKIDQGRKEDKHVTKDANAAYARVLWLCDGSEGAGERVARGREKENRSRVKEIEKSD